MREQTTELLSRLARLEDDEAADAPPFITKPLNRRDEIAVRIRGGEEPEWFRARLSNLQELDRLDLVRSDAEIGTARCEIRLTKAGRQAYEDSKHKMIILEPLLPEPGSNILDWQTEALPVLQAVYEAYSRQPLSIGIPRTYVDGVLGRAEDDPRTRIVLAALAEDGYITSVTGDEDDVPLFFKLGERGGRFSPAGLAAQAPTACRRSSSRSTGKSTRHPRTRSADGCAN
jgi:hypothetical protein